MSKLNLKTASTRDKLSLIFGFTAHSDSFSDMMKQFVRANYPHCPETVAHAIVSRTAFLGGLNPDGKTKGDSVNIGVVDPLNCLVSSHARITGIGSKDGALVLNMELQGPANKGPKSVELLLDGSDKVRLIVPSNMGANPEVTRKMLSINRVFATNGHIEGVLNIDPLSPQEHTLNRRQVVFTLQSVFAGANEFDYQPASKDVRSVAQATLDAPKISRTPKAITFEVPDTEPVPSAATVAKWLKAGLAEGYRLTTVRHGEQVLEVGLNRKAPDQPYAMEIYRASPGESRFVQQASQAVERLAENFKQGEPRLAILPTQKSLHASVER